MVCVCLSYLNSSMTVKMLLNISICGLKNSLIQLGEHFLSDDAK